MPPPSWEKRSAPSTSGERLARPGGRHSTSTTSGRKRKRCASTKRCTAESVTRAKLEGYRERIGLLRQRQLRLEEELEKAERDLQAAEAELQEARRKRLDAHRQVVKFEEYQAVLEAEQKREAERKEEAEAEDIVPLRP